MQKTSRQQLALKYGLLGYLPGKLSMDAALAPEALAGLIEGVTSKNYKGQIPVIAATLRELTAGKLAKDADISDLEDLLQELEDLDQEREDLMAEIQDVENELDSVSDAKPCKDKKLAKDDEGDDTSGSLGSTTDDEDLEEEVKEAVKPKSKKPAKQEANAMPEIPSVKQAQDIALLKAEIQTEIAAKYEAQEEVRPFVGQLNVLSMDSAASVYKIALDQAGIDTTGVDPSAFRAMVKMLHRQSKSETQTFSMDSASTDSYNSLYKTIPGKA